ncbi:MAG: hypothetical protein H6822_25835 [Planctomycetaceae bacterium]|nr:hypothetical protein [Planctomycetaceae bacterium]
MHLDEPNEFRPLLEDDPPKFVDRVDTPWSRVPDLAEYNLPAYRRIQRALKQMQREQSIETSTSQGVLVLGEAGTGKTHLLMRVANNLSDTNHILFVRKPNNEEAVAQHIWSNIVNSLARSVPSSSTPRSQMDDLLAHVFSKVLIPEFEDDISQGKDVDQRRRWMELLLANPFNLFSMLGEGERRQSNMQIIRRRTLRYLQVNYPDVDQRIAHLLITYCFVSREDRKRLLLTWLSGQDVDESESEQLGLPTSWVPTEDTSTDISVQQQREEQALRAIRTIGLLSTHYQPLILAFDQLEGLRDEERLTQRWGDVVREIFTMTPNMLIVTCIFPSLWETWFAPTLDASVAQRISQTQITLEQFETRHGLKMLETHLDDSFIKHRLPTNIYPFMPSDVESLCKHSSSPRTFVQNARTLFDDWLDESTDVGDWEGQASQQLIVTQAAIDKKLEERLAMFEKQQKLVYHQEIPIEEDFFGRIRSIIRTVLEKSSVLCSYERAKYGTRVMPPNVVIQPNNGSSSVCIAVMQRNANSFAARLKNLREVKGEQFKELVMIRDRRCSPLGPRCREYVDDIQAEGAEYIMADLDEIALLQGIYDVLVAIEEHDVTIGSHEVDKGQLVRFLNAHNIYRRSQLFRKTASRASFLAACTSAPQNLPSHTQTDSMFFQPNVSSDESPESFPQRETINLAGETTVPSPAKQNQLPTHSGYHLHQVPASVLREDRTMANTLSRTMEEVAVVIGDTDRDSPHLGIMGTLLDDDRRLAISLTKPQCFAILGYMGSGKSYSLGVLIENALLQVPGLVQHTRPLSVVAFNYRRNPESRFEYAGFAKPNSDTDQVTTLFEDYGGQPKAIAEVNVFAFEPEIGRRATEYAGLRTFPIQFRSDELGAEHWEILMKPPTPQAEYMDIIRDIIQDLFYKEQLTYAKLEQRILSDERMSETQRRRAQNRLSFASRWLCDDRAYDWADVLREGVLNVFDLRMQTLESSEALKLVLIITDLVRRTRNGVNKLIVFDEAHEYVDSKHLVSELENAITQVRHDGLSFVLASQFPDRIPETIFKYLVTRLIFKLPQAKSVAYLRRAASNLDSLSPQRVSNLDLEKGLCLIQTDDDCTDATLRSPQLLNVRPRFTQHGGTTVRQIASDEDQGKARNESLSPRGESFVSTASPSPDDSGDEAMTLESLKIELGISWNRLLALLGLPEESGIIPSMTLGEARRLNDE